MYEVFANILAWTAVGSVCHVLVVAVRMKLADRRRTAFKEKTYWEATNRAMTSTREAAKIYRSVPRGAISDDAFRVFAKRQDHLNRLLARWSRERPKDVSRY